MSTEIQFVVEAVLKSQGYVLARICEPGDFVLTSTATLKDISILPSVTQPRALDSSGKPRTDIFAFHPKMQTDISHFKEGETVILRP
jgi:hypothetical protein